MQRVANDEIAMMAHEQFRSRDRTHEGSRVVSAIEQKSSLEEVSPVLQAV